MRSQQLGHRAYCTGYVRSQEQTGSVVSELARDRTVRDGEGRATRVPGDPKHDTAAGLGDLELIAALDGMAAASDVPSPAQSHHSAIKH